MQYQPTDKMRELFPKCKDWNRDFQVLLENWGMKIENALELWLIEPVTEKPKSVWDLKPGQTCYRLYSDWSISVMEWLGSEDDKKCRLNGSIFLTYEDAKNELIRRQTACREGKFVPAEWEMYWYWRSAGGYPYNTKNIGHWFDTLIIQDGLAFRTEKECEDYMTDEVKRAFGLV